MYIIEKLNENIQVGWLKIGFNIGKLNPNVNEKSDNSMKRIPWNLY